MTYSNFARRKGSKNKKGKKGSVAGTAAKALGGAALLAAGTRYGGAALLKRSAGARGLVDTGLNKAFRVADKFNKSPNSAMKSIGNAIEKRATGARMSVMSNTGARGTARADLARVGNAVKAAKEKVGSMVKRKKKD